MTTALLYSLGSMSANPTITKQNMKSPAQPQGLMFRTTITNHHNDIADITTVPNVLKSTFRGMWLCHARFLDITRSTTYN